MTAQAKDLKVGTKYWLDDSRQISGVCVEVGQHIVKFKGTPDQPERYMTDSKGYILFPTEVPYEYKQVEA